MKELTYVYCISVAIVLYFEFSHSSTIIHVSSCCKSEYKEITDKDGLRYYCLDCKKWCKLTKEAKKNAKQKSKRKKARA